VTVSNSPLSYNDCYTVMAAALEDPNGIRLRMADQDAALYFRMRCHQARKIDRDKNSETYPKGEPLHRTSAYDKLVLRIRLEGMRSSGQDKVWWLYIEKNSIIPGIAESLTSGNAVEMELPQRVASRSVSYEPILQLSAPTTNEALGEAFEEVPAVVEAPKVDRIRRI
jgi:hypothetical protein